MHVCANVGSPNRPWPGSTVRVFGAARYNTKYFQRAVREQMKVTRTEAEMRKILVKKAVRDPAPQQAPEEGPRRDVGDFDLELAQPRAAPIARKGGCWLPRRRGVSSLSSTCGTYAVVLQQSNYKKDRIVEVVMVGLSFRRTKVYTHELDERMETNRGTPSIRERTQERRLHSTIP